MGLNNSEPKLDEFGRPVEKESFPRFTNASDTMVAGTTSQISQLLVGAANVLYSYEKREKKGDER